MVNDADGLIVSEARDATAIELFRVAARHPPLKLVFAFDFNVGHNYSQHLLWTLIPAIRYDIDSS